MSPARRRTPSRLLVVSNRLPFVFTRRGRQWIAEPGSGGLVSALLPVLRNRGGTWIGWPGVPGASRDVARALASVGRGAGYRLAGVALTEEEVRGFYMGFSNEVLWPLFHDLPSLCRFDPDYWRVYVKANRKYARVVHARAAASDLVWVHDYHLMLLPQMIREEIGSSKKNVKIGFFLHTPFPSSEIYRILPVRKALLEGVLHCDLIGFHTYDYARHFLSSCSRIV